MLSIYSNSDLFIMDIKGFRMELKQVVLIWYEMNDNYVFTFGSTQIRTKVQNVLKNI